MRKRFLILLSVLLLLVVGVLIWQASQPREPIYRGKTVTYWLYHPLTFQVSTPFGPKSSNDVAIDFPPMDSNAVPILIAHLQDRDGALHKGYNIARTKLPAIIRARLPSPVPATTIQIRAALLLGRVGLNSRPTAAALIRMMKDAPQPLLQFCAAQSLQEMSHEMDDPDKMITDAWREAATNNASPMVRQIANDALLGSRQLNRYNVLDLHP